MDYSIKEQDFEVFELIEKELERQNEHLEMIASENFTFPSVMEAMGSILTNKYAEGYPFKRYYGGCEFVDKIEEIAIERAKKLFGANFVNVQPHSGSQANAAVYAAILKPYDKILGMDLSHGGHLTHGAKVSTSGQLYQSFFYGVELNGRIDYDKLALQAQVVKPNVLVCGFSAYTRELDFKRLREIADSVGAYLGLWLQENIQILFHIAILLPPRHIKHCADLEVERFLQMMKNSMLKSIRLYFQVSKVDLLCILSQERQ